MRAAALAAEIDAALGRTAVAPSNGRLVNQEAENGAASSPHHEHGSKLESASMLQDLTSLSEEEPIADTNVLEKLRAVFGHSGFLPGQTAVINRVLAGADTLGILPTGAGKSLTFQLPSLLLPGTTLVLSPLIALMKDQVESLPPALRARTVLVNSTLTPAEQQRAMQEITAGAYKLVYAAPERLRQHGFLRALRQAGVSLVVVDEAHCISLWGHDFRPDYLSIPAALPELGDPPLLAMTATASPRQPLHSRARSGAISTSSAPAPSVPICSTPPRDSAQRKKRPEGSSRSAASCAARASSMSRPAAMRKT